MLEDIFCQSILDDLYKNKIYSALHFLETDADKLARITGVSVKEIFALRQKFVEEHSPRPLNWASFKSSNILKTGIESLDVLLNGGLRCGSVSEICGLSGSGKTQLCMNIAVNVAKLGQNVLYCDSKGDFSPSHCLSIAKTNFSEDVVKFIKVMKPQDIYQFISLLHNLKNRKLIILDSITVFSFPFIGSPVDGLRLLNHALLMMKKYAVENNAAVLLTNLASQPFDQNEGFVENKKNVEPLDLIPFMGRKYWQHAPHVRLVIFKDSPNIRSVWVSKSHTSKKGNNCKLKLQNSIFL